MALPVICAEMSAAANVAGMAAFCFVMAAGEKSIECDCSSGAGLDVARNGWFSAGSYDSATEVLPIGTHRQLP